MTVRETGKNLQCVYLSPFESLGVPGLRPCGFPTTRCEYAELDPMQPPELQTTIRPICETHEIALYLEELKDGS